MQSRIDIPDFETLSKLYLENPQAYEILRLEILKSAVAAAPVDRRPLLQHTLYRIESARQATSTPQEAINVAARMMTESWGRLQNAWEQLHFDLARLQTNILLERLRK